MDGLVLDYRDPLFGVIVFISLVFILAFFSYWWGIFKSKEENEHISNFLKQFDSSLNEVDLNQLLESENIPLKSLLLLASTYYNHGEFEKCIKIYLNIIERNSNEIEKMELLLLLGKTYFKAGFLQRAQETLLAVLKIRPRTPEALNYLIVIYEKLQKYKKALAALEPLEEMQINIEKDLVYLSVMTLIHEHGMDLEEKNTQLLSIYKNHNMLSRLIFEHLFRSNFELAWKELDQSQCQDMVDILWNLPQNRLNLEVVQNNSFLKELYTAKGYLNEAKSSSIFELDMLINLQKSAYSKATLQFEYLCSECKYVFPFPFTRCPHCLGIDTLKCETMITRNYIEANNSLQ